ncbi:hypothetical protein [Saliphagus sp. LR7]|uniref:hypothetical protein n=1 Tax=Saliphagus sp. LR7 TaxID=2282654 RepID=UPI000DF7904D|nr:hypothetical protein [Saliphagus sp. LR7]
MQKITTEHAHELVDEAASGTLLVSTIDPVPTIGDVPDDKRQFRHDLAVYHFGNPEADAEEGLDDE